MRKKLFVIVLALSLAFVVMLSGCTARRPMYTNDNGFDTTRNNIGYNDTNMGRQQGYGGTGANYGTNNNTRNNATGNNTTGNNTNYPGLPTLPNGYGNATGFNNGMTNNRTANNNGNNNLGNNNAGNNMLGTDNKNATNNQNLERTCEAVNGVQDATVVTTGNTAYVGIDSMNNSGADLTRIKREVADRIRSSNQDINVVYVSEADDFNNRLRTVGDRMRNGNNGDNFTNDLREMVRNVVPQTLR
jgi:YhcN/YlaJ family sporulation lipoprotein